MSPPILHAWIGRFAYRFMFLEFAHGLYIRVDLRSDLEGSIVIGSPSPSSDFWLDNNKPGPDFDGFELDANRLASLNAAWRIAGPTGICALKDDIYAWGREVAENMEVPHA